MRVLDLFCGVGGASVGYSWSGATVVVGVDIVHQKDYPFEFYQGDATDESFVRSIVDVAGPFDLIHASPPCQAYSSMTRSVGDQSKYPDLVDVTRQVLARSGSPSVIENVAGAPIRKDVFLCGEMFGLDVVRHRYFEVEGFRIPSPQHVAHRGRVNAIRHGVYHRGPYVAVYGNGTDRGTVEKWREAMEIDWTTRKRSIAEAIPPAYTEWIGWWFRRITRSQVPTPGR